MPPSSKDREKSPLGGSISSKQRDKKLLVGLIWNCAAELKLIIIALFLLCSFITLLHFLPVTTFSLSPAASLRSDCLSTTISTANTTTVPPPPPPKLPRPSSEETLENGVVKRSFNPYGIAAYNFILAGAYRGEINSFAIIGLSSKPLHVYGRPTYTCEYITNTNISTAVRGNKLRFPDWGFGRMYTTVVVNCTFPPTSPVTDPTPGGRLIIHASTNGALDHAINYTDTFEALVEPPNSWNHTDFLSPPKYDFLYCGSSLYGGLSPQRIREWMAYHVRLFGRNSHFVFHDAGGVHPEVMAVLDPWKELGYVSIQDIKEQERFDGYYHNQFLMVNDCLHRHRSLAKWIFFFDVDEFVYVDPQTSLKSVMDSLDEFTQITIEQMPMSNQLCLSQDAPLASRKWEFEKLVYRDVKKVARKDRKYAVQPRNVLATGVHLSLNLLGQTNRLPETVMKYFHFHGTIAEHQESCRHFANKTSTKLDDNPYVLDKSLRSLGGLVKRFELDTIGPRLQNTRL